MAPASRLNVKRFPLIYANECLFPLSLSPKILDSSRQYSSRFTRHLAYSNTRVPTKFSSEARAYNSLLLLSSRHVLYLAAFVSLISLLVTISALSAFYSFFPCVSSRTPTQLSCLLPILTFSLFLSLTFLLARTLATERRR